MLHGVGRRGAPRRLRHARPPHRRAPGHHPRGSAGGTARALGGRVRRNTGPASAASARPASSSGWPRSKGREPGTPPSRARHRVGPARTPVPVHRLAVHRRRRVQRAGRRRWLEAVRGRSSEPAVGRVAGPGRRAGLSEFGPGRVLGGGGFADDSAPRDALVQLGADGAARPRPARRPGREWACAGQEQHGAAVAPRRAAGRRLGTDTADVLARARLRRAGRELVPPRRHSRLAAGQRRRVRGQAPQPGARRRSGARRRQRRCRPRAVAA